MNDRAADPDSDVAWGDALLAAELFATDPFGLGGIVLRSPAGAHRDRLCAWARALLPAGAPTLRIPLHITEDRLLGGLSLAATLNAGKVVAERGLLAHANGGVVVVAMAERIDAFVASHLCAAVDRGEIALERDGITATIPCRVGVIALDEGLDDERAPDALRDRLAFRVDLTSLRSVDSSAKMAEIPDPTRIAAARACLARVVTDGAVVDALCRAADALGVESLRGPLLAAAAARAHAALEGRARVEEEDVVVGARLVLGSRATRIPVDRDDVEDQEEPTPPEPPADAGASEPDEAETQEPPTGPMDDLVLEAAKSAIPAGLLDALTLGLAPRSAARSQGHAGAVRASMQGGRPAGIRAAMPKNGERLNVVETLRAAAPWQRIRRQARSATAPSTRRVEVRKDDFRITRFEQRTETSVIFSVDASGSAALQRLAEAKGAVEQVLADCYVRRDHVALISFRGMGASLLLPPTRSLARVRKCLADLAGGGTTPLASGIDAALALALEARKRGKTPVIVVMTDGRANIARDGRAGGIAANEDATSSARAVRIANVRALFLDTAPRPRPHAQALATEMGARYLPLPYLDAVGISRHVKSLSEVAS